MLFKRLIIILLSALLVQGVLAVDSNSEKNTDGFAAGKHYVVLDRPVPVRDNTKIEVVEMFSYGCPHCYEFEPLIRKWSDRQADDVDFWFIPAVWNEPMKVYARAFYTAHDLNVQK